MASEADSSSESSRKRMKLSEDSDVTTETVAEDLSAHLHTSSLKRFELRQVLSDNGISKCLFFEGHFEPSKHSTVVLLEKLPIQKDSIQKILYKSDLALNLKIPANPSETNVVHYACYPSVERGDMKATLVCPATPKHIDKYKYQPLCVINETPDIYQRIVLPHLESQKFSIQWVYNILDHISEADRIVFEDPDPQLGFVLLPDMKSDASEMESIYLIAICRARGIKSLRDITSFHLPLLYNIKTKALAAIDDKYGIKADKLRIYFHYQPSYYHMHIHFTSIHRHAPGINFERAHLLDNVINNVELQPTYYQDTVLTYNLKENDHLYIALQNAGVVGT